MVGQSSEPDIRHPPSYQAHAGSGRWEETQGSLAQGRPQPTQTREDQGMTRVQKARARQGPRPTPPPGPPTKHHGRLRILIGLAVVITAFTAFVTPGFAEFESGETSDKGSGEAFLTKIYDGGSSITCTAFGKEGSKASWSTEKEGKLVEKGSLLIKIENWGKCEYLTASQAVGEAKLSACEIEVAQPEEQEKLSGKLVNTCTIKISSCEITLPSKENTSLNSIEFIDGEEPEELFFIPGIGDIHTEVSAGCAALGIQASSKVAMQGDGGLKKVKAKTSREFGTGWKPAVTGTEMGWVRVKRIAGANGKLTHGSIDITEAAGTGQFTVDAASQKNCEEEFNYILNGAACEVKISYDKSKGEGFVLFQVKGANGVKGGALIHGN
jgi:hypothetical protein